MSVVVDDWYVSASSNCKFRELELEIDTAYHSRTFGVGYTGTAELEEEISLPIFKGARVAFIDALVTPGEYRVLVRNKGDKSEIINGHIYIY